MNKVLIFILSLFLAIAAFLQFTLGFFYGCHPATVYDRNTGEIEDTEHCHWFYGIDLHDH